MTAFDRQELTSSGGPAGDLRVRVTGLGEWGIRIAELLDGDGVTSFARRTRTSSSAGSKGWMMKSSAPADRPATMSCVRVWPVSRMK